jgi:uncharacterized protein (DUF1499 family)
MAADQPPPAIHELAPCPERRNCVSSLATDPGQRVEPLPLAGEPAEALARLAEIIEAMPRARVVESAEGYLRAEFRSLLFGFVDDLELAADPAAGVVHVRSASRVGASDLGVNRRRVERIRSRYRPPPG